MRMSCDGCLGSMELAPLMHRPRGPHRDTGSVLCGSPQIHSGMV